MRIAVIDTETTGLSETDQVCELAIVNLYTTDGEKWETGETWSQLIRPTCSVSLEARAVHHIGDAELEFKKTMSEMLMVAELPPLHDVDVVAGHNLEFDLRMLRQSGVPDAWLPQRRICTWKCAMHLVEAPKYSNQVLRYHLNLDVPGADVIGPSHRALSDASVTAALLRLLLSKAAVTQLTDWTAERLLPRVMVGKYQGQPWEKMDSGYLHWVLNQNFGEDVKYTARHWIDKKRREQRA